MKQVSDDQIIGDAIRLVQEGMAVTMLVKGRSMLPFILGGQESAVLTQPGEIKTGDVVLARIDGRRCWPVRMRSWVRTASIGGLTRRGRSGERASGADCCLSAAGF